MDRRRLIVIGLAGLAAIVAIFLMRALLGGGTPKVDARPEPQIATAQVLVAAKELAPGTKLDAQAVRWIAWPKTAMDSSYITHAKIADLDKFMRDAVVRMPLVNGQPITAANVVHSDSAGFMSANVSPGMRAVSVAISAETGAGGFILPNDRVDVVVTSQVSSNPRRYRANTILHDVRVLSVGQTYKKQSDQNYVLGKTATLEVTPSQAELISRAAAGGTLSLALRSLASSDPNSTDAALASERGGANTEMSVIRYGVARIEAGQQRE